MSDTYQVMTLSAMGDAETPAGGSVCIRCVPIVSLIDFRGCRRQHKSQPRAEDMLGDATDWLIDDILIKLTLKSRMRRRRADVDMVACAWTVLSGRQDGCDG